MMAVDKRKFNRLTSELTEWVRRYHRKEPDRLLSFHYVEAFRDALPYLKREGLSGGEITDLRKAVLKKLGIK